MMLEERGWARRLLLLEDREPLMGRAREEGRQRATQRQRSRREGRCIRRDDAHGDPRHSLESTAILPDDSGRQEARDWLLELFRCLCTRSDEKSEEIGSECWTCVMLRCGEPQRETGEMKVLATSADVVCFASTAQRSMMRWQMKEDKR